MWQIPVFAAEREAGLEEQIRTQASVAYASRIEIPTPGTLPANNELLARLSASLKDRSVASVGDFDLHYLRTVLASTGWNNNDDVFDPLEVWSARATPEDKPFNYEHDCSDIIGHIVANEVVDEQGKVVGSDSTADDLPAKFHVITSAVLYKCWAKKELQERMDLILAEIIEDKWFVSMEALFKGFDYALIDSGGVHQVVARNKDTAFLTKHLRAYGGKGIYNNAKVGRLMRNIVFSGKGLVRKPANPESVILSQAYEFSAASKILTSLPNRPQAVGYREITSQVSLTVSPESKQNMEPDLATLQQQVAKLSTENARLQAELKENDVKQVQAKASDLEKQLGEAKATIVELTSAKDKAEKDKEDEEKKAKEAKDKADATQKELDETKAKLAEIEATAATEKRTNLVVEKLAVAREEADQIVADLADLPEEKFSAQIDRLKAAYDKAKTVEYPNNGLSPTGDDKKKVAKTPPKSTPAKDAPKVTDKTTASETEETNADPANLDNAEPSKTEAALSTNPASSGVEEVRRSIAKYFRATPEDEE